MQIPSPRSRKKARIEIIPLIDIMFFLLATFMMVSLSMVKNQGITLALPKSASAVPQPKTDHIVLSLDAGGAYYFNKTRTSLEDIRQRLRQLQTLSSEVRVTIQGDDKAEFGRAIELLDEVRLLGITKVSIQTQPKGS
jgi:biopolymer transport protein ExbD